MAEIPESLRDALIGVDLSAPSTVALQPLGRLLGSQLAIAFERVYPISVSRPGNLVKQAGQSERARQARLLVVVLRDQALTEAVVRQAPALIGPSRFAAVLVVLTTIDEATRRIVVDASLSDVVQGRGDTIAATVESLYPGVHSHDVTPAHPGTPPGPAVTGPPLAPLPASTVPAPPLVVDPRLRRMLRLAIASSRAVMLVGPPGTGKTTMLDDAIRDLQAHPEAYGLTHAPAGMLQVTPEEGWTTREIVGGETVDDQGRLRFRPGHLLEAIRSDRWLVLDEANRADMDRILGAALTWLSLHAVSLGRASGDLDAPEIRLEWRDEPTSEVVGYGQLESGTGNGAVRFIAGRDWRLLGTYNALDAQRVFRFGQALGRRFARVPVPAIDLEQFVQALAPYLERLPEAVLARVEEVLRGLYGAHLDTPPPVGPALFLSIPAYVAGGLELGADDLIQSEGGIAPAATASDELLEELLVEGYLIGAGSWLAQLESEELDRFHDRVVNTEGLIGKPQWQFLIEQLPALA